MEAKLLKKQQEAEEKKKFEKTVDNVPGPNNEIKKVIHFDFWKIKSIICDLQYDKIKEDSSFFFLQRYQWNAFQEKNFFPKSANEHIFELLKRLGHMTNVIAADYKNS